MARPSKLTPATEKVIIDALRAGATRTAAFQAAGIARSKISVYMRRFGTFRDAVLQAEAQAEVYMTVKLRQAVDAGSLTAITFWLERRRRDEWGRRVTLDVADEIREMVRAAGLGDDVAAEAVVEAQEILKRTRSG